MTMMLRLVVGVVLLSVLRLVVQSLPDVGRYLKMRAM